MAQIKTKFITDLAVTTAKIAADAVDNSKLADMPTMTIKGNDTGGSANPQDLTAAEVNALLGTDAIAADVADLVTLTGVPANSTDLGTFTGAIIPDNSDIKEALQSLESFIEAIPNPFYYAGLWAASTNTPTLANTDTGVQGAVYYVTDSGTVNFGAGAISFDAGDKVANNGTTWDKWDMTDAVSSVFGRTGTVTAQSGDYTATQVTNTPAGGISATNVQTAINELDTEKANLASPTFTGIPAAPTAAPGTNTTQLATTAFVTAAGALKANVSLNNLASTAVNVSIVPAADGTINLGSPTNQWLDVYSTEVITPTLAFDTDLSISAGGNLNLTGGEIVIDTPQISFATDLGTAIGTPTVRVAQINTSDVNSGDLPLNLRGDRISIQNLVTDPVTANAGDIYYNSVSNVLRYYDGTDWLDVTPAAAVQPIATEEHPTLNGTNITNQYFDLLHPVIGASASVNSVCLSVVGGPEQLKGTDYTVSLTGGAGGVTRITFAGDLATGGGAALIAGDILMIKYSY